MQLTPAENDPCLTSLRYGVLSKYEVFAHRGLRERDQKTRMLTEVSNKIARTDLGTNCFPDLKERLRKKGICPKAGWLIDVFQTSGAEPHNTDVHFL